MSLSGSRFVIWLGWPSTDPAVIDAVSRGVRETLERAVQEAEAHEAHLAWLRRLLDAHVGWRP